MLSVHLKKTGQYTSTNMSKRRHKSKKKDQRRQPEDNGSDSAWIYFLTHSPLKRRRRVKTFTWQKQIMRH